MEDNQDNPDVHIKLLKRIGWLDWLIIVMVVGFSAYSFWTLNHLDNIQDKCLNKCNEFWLEQFKAKCQNDLYKQNIENSGITIDPYILRNG